eukprot:5080140-Amphidinium_carterae.1
MSYWVNHGHLSDFRFSNGAGRQFLPSSTCWKQIGRALKAGRWKTSSLNSRFISFKISFLKGQTSEELSVRKAKEVVMLRSCGCRYLSNVVPLLEY